MDDIAVLLIIIVIYILLQSLPLKSHSEAWYEVTVFFIQIFKMYQEI